MTKRLYDLDTASQHLGISKEAIRKRIQRGTLEAAKDGEGRWRVYLDMTEQDKSKDNGEDVGRDASGRLVQQMQREIDFLRAELERKDHILMSLTNKIPQLEQPKHPEAHSDQGEGFFKKLFKGWGV